MRIVFLGASELGYLACKSLIDQKYSVVGILTIPSEFKIKYRTQASETTVKNVLYKDFLDFSTFGIPVVEATTKLKEYSSLIQSWNPDIIIVIGWYYMIPDVIMRIPAKGVIGIHASLLPKYRGNAPLVWALINGEKETGVSLFYIEGGVDEGDIIAQQRFEILPEDNISHLLEKTKTSTLNVLAEFLPLIQSGNAPRIKQNNKDASVFPARTPADGEIDWSWEPERIANFIRAQTKPYPGAFTIIGDKKVILWDAEVVKIDTPI